MRTVVRLYNCGPVQEALMEVWILYPASFTHIILSSLFILQEDESFVGFDMMKSINPRPTVCLRLLEIPVFALFIWSNSLITLWVPLRWELDGRREGEVLGGGRKKGERVTPGTASFLPFCPLRGQKTCFLAFSPSILSPSVSLPPFSFLPDDMLTATVWMSHWVYLRRQLASPLSPSPPLSRCHFSHTYRTWESYCAGDSSEKQGHGGFLGQVR